MTKKSVLKSKYPLNWDLSELYGAADDPKIISDIKKYKNAAVRFEKKHRGNVVKYSPKRILSFLKEYESLYKKIYLVDSFVDLLFSLDTRDEKANAALQKFELAYTEISSHFIFIDLELAEHPRLKILGEEAMLKPYRIIFQNLLIQKKHHLTHAEERILNIESMTSRSGWAKLFDKTMAEAKYGMLIKGDKRVMNQEQILNMLHSPEQQTRRLAAEGFTEGLKEQSKLIVYINNMLLVNKMQHDKLRKFQYPEEFRHLDNGVTKKSVDVLAEITAKNFKLVSRYYETKQVITKLKKFYDYDRYAPLTMPMLKKGARTLEKYPYDKGVEIVSRAFSEFDREFGKIFKEIVAARHVDVSAREGKRSGAYCRYMPAPHMPYVLLNYLDDARDVQTLAHEMGHAIHDYLAHSQPVLVSHPPLVLAETASVFGEMIVFENLYASTITREEKIILLAQKIEDITATTFRQMSMFSFEQKVHAHIRANGEIGYKKFCEFWIETQSRMYGTSVEMSENYSHWWSYIPHFIHTPFYVYAYAFGNLLVLSMYEQFKKGNGNFVEKYKRFLALGGSKKPQEAADIFGFDLESPKFWQNGFKAVEDLISQLENLV